MLPARNVPLFDRTPAPSATVWRYLTFGQLIPVLEGKLHCTRVDQFVDKLEGQWPRADVAYWSNPANGASLEGLRNIKRHAVVSCCVEERKESAAMWSLYGKTSESVALKTSYSALKAQIDSQQLGQDEWSIGSVRYMDFGGGNGLMASPGADGYRHSIFKVLTLKHDSYKHECEVRAVGLRIGSEMPEGGLCLPIEAASLIEAIIVNPNANDWFIDCVREVALRFGLQSRVCRSEIAELETSLG